MLSPLSLSLSLLSLSLSPTLLLFFFTKIKPQNLASFDSQLTSSNSLKSTIHCRFPLFPFHTDNSIPPFPHTSSSPLTLPLFTNTPKNTILTPFVGPTCQRPVHPLPPANPLLIPSNRSINPPKRKRPTMPQTRQSHSPPSKSLHFSRTFFPPLNTKLPLTMTYPINSVSASPMLRRRREFLLRSNLSMDASCSSDASSDSLASRASTGRMIRRGSGTVGEIRRRKSFSEPGKGLACGTEGSGGGRTRCGWVTANTDPCYIAFHDEEWGVPIHDDKKLFEMLVLSGALAELSWPVILSKRHIFREVFMDFDPALVAKINEKKLAVQGSLAASLLSETKLRAIVENAREVLKIIQQFGSFNRYMWGFTNHKPILGRFRYQRQVPVKTPKADFISKDLVRRGFRGVGPTVIYSFMQAAGLTNDHLLSCSRFEECYVGIGTGIDVGGTSQSEKLVIGGETGIKLNIDEPNIS